MTSVPPTEAPKMPSTEDTASRFELSPELEAILARMGDNLEHRNLMYAVHIADHYLNAAKRAPRPAIYRTKFTMTGREVASTRTAVRPRMQKEEEISLAELEDLKGSNFDWETETEYVRKAHRAMWIDVGGRKLRYTLDEMPPEGVPEHRISINPYYEVGWKESQGRG